MQTLRRSKPFWALLLSLSASALVLGSVAGSAPVWADSGEKKLSTREMKKKMKEWARELGQKCEYCHVKDGEEYDYEVGTPKKKIAAFCEEQFVEKLATKKGKPITCGTCHPQTPTFLPRPEKKEDEENGGVR